MWDDRLREPQEPSCDALGRMQSMRAMTAGELMTAPVVTIAAGDSVEEAAAVLHRERLSRLVVTDQQ